MSVLAQVGALNGQDIQNLTPIAGSAVVLSQPEAPGVLFVDEWMRFTSNNALFQVTTEAVTPAPGESLEFEISAVFYFNLTVSGSAFLPLFFDNGAGSVTDIRLDIVNGELIVGNRMGDDVNINTATGHLVTQGTVLPMNMRVRFAPIPAEGETPSRNLQVEIWVNGDILLYTFDGDNTNQTANVYQGLFSHRPTIRSHQSAGGHVRDMVFRDSWSTPQGVAPGVPHVIEREIIGLIPEAGTTWTNASGAPISPADIDTFNDATYIETTEASAHVVAELEPLPAYADGFPEVTTTTSLRAGRAPFDPTDLETVAVTDSTGTTVIGTPDLTPVTTGIPAKSELEVPQLSSTPDFIRITNGS